MVPIAEGVSLDDVSRIIRLVHEVCDRWDDPRAWRARLLQGLCELMDASVGLMLAQYGGKEGVFGKLVVTSAVGVPPQMAPRLGPAVSRMEWRDYGDVSDNFMPGMTRLYGQLVRQGWATAARKEITDEASYHAAPMYRELWKPMDCDDYVVSVRLVDLPRRAEGINLERPHGAAAFGAREVALLKLVHDQIAPLIGVRLATEKHLSRDGLSRRLRETLNLLLLGRSEKETAREMRLAWRTVHDYVTMLYRHFEVSSRAELMAYFVKREPAQKPAVTPLPARPA